MRAVDPERSEREAADRFEEAHELVLRALRELVDSDWSMPAGTLQWSCRETLDHMIDCILSYALQLAAQAEDGFLPFQQLHPLPEATTADLVDGLRGVGRIFAALIRAVPADSVASDGVYALDVDEWAARGSYEILLHAHDVLRGHGVRFEPPATLCRWVLASPRLWMLDRDLAAQTRHAWEALLLGSGRRGS